MGICIAAINERIPIAHLHGGEVTEGAVDECVRHAVTKMSYLHFAANNDYRRRIIRLGENPDRVINVGALGVENVLKAKLMEKKALKEQLGIPHDRPYIVVTFHPVTLEAGREMEQVEELIKAIKQNDQYYYIVTMANADAGGEIINKRFDYIQREMDNIKLVSSLGMIRYLSAVKYCEFVMGNSSSGIIEAPALGIPTINIGSRQSGRLMADTIINCEPNCEQIVQSMKRAEKLPHTKSDIYGDGETSGRIVGIIKDYLINEKIDTKKKFYDMQNYEIS